LGELRIRFIKMVNNIKAKFEHWFGGGSACTSSVVRNDVPSNIPINQDALGDTANSKRLNITRVKNDAIDSPVTKLSKSVVQTDLDKGIDLLQGVVNMTVIDWGRMSEFRSRLELFLQGLYLLGKCDDVQIAAEASTLRANYKFKVYNALARIDELMPGDHVKKQDLPAYKREIEQWCAHVASLLASAKNLRAGRVVAFEDSIPASVLTRGSSDDAGAVSKPMTLAKQGGGIASSQAARLSTPHLATLGSGGDILPLVRSEATMQITKKLNLQLLRSGINKLLEFNRQNFTPDDLFKKKLSESLVSCVVGLMFLRGCGDKALSDNVSVLLERKIGKFRLSQCFSIDANQLFNDIKVMLVHMPKEIALDISFVVDQVADLLKEAEALLGAQKANVD
jgi:hypothetical protein